MFSGIFRGGPADLHSTILDPAVVGGEHYRVAQEVIRILQRKDLQDIIAILGIDEALRKRTRAGEPGAAYRAAS